jgi:hypothetical protein
VQTVTGYRVNLPIANQISGGAREGLSAHVCDSVYLYEVVATYRSEHRRDGRARAVREAEAHAERLNRDAA